LAQADEWGGHHLADELALSLALSIVAISAEERGRLLAERAAGHSRTLQGALPPQIFSSLVAIATACCIAPGRHEGRYFSKLMLFQMF